MAQNELISSIHSTYDVFWKLRRSKVLLNAFWARLENFSTHGLTDEQNEELESLLHLVWLYEQQTVPIMTELQENLDCIIEMIKEARQSE